MLVAIDWIWQDIIRRDELSQKEGNRVQKIGAFQGWKSQLFLDPKQEEMGSKEPLRYKVQPNVPGKINPQQRSE